VTDRPWWWDSDPLDEPAIRKLGQIIVDEAAAGWAQRLALAQRRSATRPSGACRFDATVLTHDDGTPCPMTPLSPAGRAFAYFYHCRSCGDVHWCVPAVEADGTASDLLDAAAQTWNACDSANVEPNNGWHRPCECMQDFVRIIARGIFPVG
jgi:hypothetical protein